MDDLGYYSLQQQKLYINNNKRWEVITPFSPWTIVILREITYICLVFGFSDVYYFYFIFRRNICSQIEIHKQEIIKSIKSHFDIHYRLIFTLMRKWWLIFWTSSGCTRVPPAVLTSCPSKVCKIKTSTVKGYIIFWNSLHTGNLRNHKIPAKYVGRTMSASSPMGTQTKFRGSACVRNRSANSINLCHTCYRRWYIESIV